MGAFKKFHWGWGIALVLFLFVLTIGYRVYVASNIEVDLITKDYYHKELNFEKEIEKKRNTEKLAQKVELQLNGDTIRLCFPKLYKFTELKGTITFYCPSETSSDLTYPISCDSSNSQIFFKKMLSCKRYIVKADWQGNQAQYYQEFELSF